MYNQVHTLTLVKKLMIKILNLKLGILLGYQNIKIFLQKAMLQIGLKRFSLLKKVKSTVLWTYFVSDLKDEEFVGMFYKKELQKQMKKSLELKK